MKQFECEFEADALSAALQSRWPDRVESELHAHIVGCPICSDVVTIASAMDEAREDVRVSAVVPDSGAVWWRAQIRARKEAAEAAGRPITAAQAVAFACMVGVLGALIGATFGATSTSLQAWLKAAFVRVESSFAGI